MTENRTTFPRRGEDRVPYGGKPARGGQRRQTEPQKKPTGGTGGTGGKRTRTGKRRRKNVKRSLQRRRMLYLIGIFAVMLLIFMGVRKNGTAVFVGQEQVGVLEIKKVTAQSLIDTLEGQLADSIGSKVKINEEIRAEGVHIGSKNKKDVCTMEHLLPKMRSMVTYKVDAAQIMVDGGKAATLANKEQAEAVLKQVQTDLLPAEGIAEDAEIGWLEKVEIVNGFVESTEIMKQEDAISILESTTETSQSYTVQTGDALYRIANMHKTTVEKLLELNPGADLQKSIRVGQVINVPVQKPKISVKSVETQVLTAVEPKTYETQFDDTKPASYQKVIQQGKAGQKKSTIQITRVNGVVTEEKEVSKEIIQEAVPEIILKGTK